MRWGLLKADYDIVVIGSGFAGSLCAMIARRQGRSVLLLERGHHPRVVIGESSTPLSNLLLEELADRYDLAEIRPLTKWGTWQAAYPQVACGLKRGFSFFHHCLGSTETDLGINEQFLVAASPHNAIADTHWYRADFDHHFVELARERGVEYLDEANILAAIESPDCMHLSGDRQRSPFAICARFVVDASGPNGCLHRLLKLDELASSGYPATQGVFSHFTDVSRIPLAHSSYPYPIEDAAVHHVFEGGWMWMLRFNNGITSAGAVVTDTLANDLRLQDSASAWSRLLQHLPIVATQFAQAKPTMPFRYLPRISFRSATIAGHRWALLPSAAGFYDPMLSTGFPLTLLGVQRLSSILEQMWEHPQLTGALADYAAITSREFDATANLIAALYANMHNPAAFQAITMLYFIAATFSETARRLGKSILAQSFLLCDHPVFGPAFHKLLAQARSGIAPDKTARFVRDMRAHLEPFDVAGLCEPREIPWYPVDADDLRRSAWKLEASREDIERMLVRSGFTPA